MLQAFDVGRGVKEIWATLASFVPELVTLGAGPAAGGETRPWMANGPGGGGYGHLRAMVVQDPYGGGCPQR